ncbi:MAG: HAD family hydrolase [Dehalococcoidales bacterium]|nr:HAD family hydrolase [Dehalococcoidales bacterium]
MSKLTGIRAISFDGDGTLWDFLKVMRHSLGHVLSELARLDPPAATMLDIDKMVEIRNKVASRLKGKTANLEAIRLEAFRQTLEEIGRPDDDLAHHLNNVYLKHRFEDIELYPDVLPALEILRHRYTLGLVSNGNSYPERCGLDGVFRFVVFAQDHGVEKPDPEIFRIALQQAGCSPEQLLHVGDSLQNDVAGAAGAGIRCIWLNRNRVSNDTGVRPDYEIESLQELMHILP